MKKHLRIIVAIMVISVVISCGETTNSDNQPPTVAITYPANNSEFVQGTIINVRAEATDNKGIKKVEFYIDGEIVETDSTNSYQYDWNTEEVSPENHTLYAKAEDINNNETQSEVIKVSIVSGDPINPSTPNPSHNSIDVSVNPIISWECSDPQGDPLLFDVYIGTDPSPGTEELVVEHQDSLYYDPGTLLHNQTYYWKIIAVDADSNEASSEIWQFTTLDVGAYINVPAEYSTIQAGIEAASDGDIVLVDPGTYIENIDFLGRNITVASKYLTTQDTSYISQTIIDGNQNGHVVSFINGESENTRLSGFTVRNGFASGPHEDSNDCGGGIFCENSSPGLDNLKIKENIAFGEDHQYPRGGGLYFKNSNSVMDNVIIINNDASYRGGGIWCSYESNLIINNSIISNNDADICGGGIACYGMSNITLNNVTISENSSRWSGGGIELYYSYLALDNVTIKNNVLEDGKGAGIYCCGNSDIISVSDNVYIKDNEGSGVYVDDGQSVLIENINVINNNGYGIKCFGGSVTLKNICIIDNYSSGFMGSGYCWGGIPNHLNVSMANVIISGNGNSNINGGGVHISSRAEANIENLVIFDNTAANGSGIYGGDINLVNSIIWDDLKQKEGRSITVSYSDIQGGWTGEGNIDTDPLFIAPDTGDFHLQPGSPCINAGNPGPEYNDPNGSRNDMGAYGGPGGNW